MPVRRFSVHFDNALRGNLQRRLVDTRWSDAITGDWQYGTNKVFLKALVEYWQTTYNFDAAEQRMNAMPQFRASIAGFGVHYVYIKGRGPRPKPLLLMNGWLRCLLTLLPLAGQRTTRLMSSCPRCLSWL